MRQCQICQVEIRYNAKSCAAHRGKSLDRKCPVCDVLLSRGNKTGYCVRHNKDGEMNPMAGRSVYDVWCEKYGKEEADRRESVRSLLSATASKKNWDNPVYRKAIKDATTGLKRTEEFRQKQSRNAFRQFEDQSQRDLRSEAIKASFARGSHSADTMASNQFGTRGFNEDGIFFASNVERQRMAFLKESGLSWKRYEVNDFDFRITYEWAGKSHLYLPDFVIFDDGKVIVEEMKSNLKHISEREWAKAKAAGPFLKERGFVYRLIDDPHYTN